MSCIFFLFPFFLFNFFYFFYLKINRAAADKAKPKPKPSEKSGEGETLRTEDWSDLSEEARKERMEAMVPGRLKALVAGEEKPLSKFFTIFFSPIIILFLQLFY